MFMRWLLCTLLLITLGFGTAIGAEPRPWLCRDKPVFSAPGHARLELTSHDRRSWRVFLMQFDPYSGHDGFTITNSYDLDSSRRRASDELSQGRFFAVALYRAGGHWICPGTAREQGSAGTVASLCYGASEGDACNVTLSVTQPAR